MSSSSAIRCILAAAAFTLAVYQPVRAGSAATLCDFNFQGCPESFSGDTIIVPDNVVALTPTIYSCRPTIIGEVAVGSTTPPSIVFIIDNSGSMHGSTGSDPTSARFSVTSALLDTIAAHQPSAEVGLVVYTDFLNFDIQNSDPTFNQYLRALPQVYDGEPSQAYLPLMKLDSLYNGRFGIDIIKGLLATAPTGGGGGGGRPDLIYRPTSFTPSQYTNINVAMIAAKAAMSRAVNTKDRQFVVYLSDGDPQGDIQAGLDPNDFANGVNMPTTFTVFFRSGATTGSTLINTMTQNIQNNGYSATNPNSAVWVIAAQYDSLMHLIMKNMMSQMLTIKTGTPYAMTVNGVASTAYIDSHFVFSQRFPLQPTVLTHYNFIVKYSYVIQVTGQTGTTTKDTTITADFYVRRSSTGPYTPNITTICWPRSTIDLYFNGAKVTTVNDTMVNLEARVTVGGGITPSAVSAIVQSKTAKDNETYALTSAAGYWTVTFARAIGTAVPNDKTLQNAAPDSIILIYRNPAVPIDTVRKAYPFVISRTVAVNSASYFDRNADGYIDSIFVGISGTLSDVDMATIAQWTELPVYRNFNNPVFKAVTGGFAIIVDESRTSSPRTGVTVEDRLVVHGGILPHGGLVTDATLNIADKVAPVIVRASGSINPAGRDTVFVYFSEPPAQITSTQPLSFSHTGGAAYTQDLTLASIQPDGRYIFLAAGTGVLKSGDTVWINPAALVGDTLKARNNQANPANRHVLLPISITRMLTVLNATYFDRNADGYIDSIFVGIQGNAIPEDLPLIKQGMGLPAARGFTNEVLTVVPGGVGITLAESQAAPPHTNVTKDDQLIVAAGPLSNGGWINDGVFAIADKVAPVIVRAAATHNTAAGDSLIIYFSEPVNAITATQPFQFMHTDNTTYTQTLKPISVRSDGGYVFAVTDASQLTTGDLVWINPTGQVSDIVSNGQSNPANRRVPLQLTTIQVFTARTATYFDRNADGYIDSIFVAMDGSLTAGDLASFQALATLPASRGFGPPVYSIVTGGLAIVADENHGVDPHTGVTAEDKLAIQAGVLPSGSWVTAASIDISDKVAPVIVRAAATSGAVGSDTLTITFSEAVNPVGAGQPFVYIHSDATGFTQTLTEGWLISGTTYGFAVAAKDTSRLRRGDQIWINAQATLPVGDVAGNNQANPANRKVPIVITLQPYTVMPQAVHNPLTIGSGASVIPPRIAQLTGYTQQEGLILRIEPLKALRSEVVLSGRASIYDVVKNPIVQDQNMAFDPTTHRLYFVWDGRNTNGRAVATGTYLAVMVYSDNQENIQHTKTLRIGVKR